MRAGEAAEASVSGLAGPVRAIVVMTVLVLPWWTANASPARAPGPSCLSDSGDAAIALSMVKDVVTSAAPDESALRASNSPP